MSKKICLALLLSLFYCLSVKSQDVALKTNMIYDATATVNAGVEIGIASKWTLDVSGNFNCWTMSEGKRWKHWFVQPEARYWLCDRFSGHFFGVHAHGGQFNIGGIDNDFKFLGTDFSVLSDKRVQGWFAGAGVAYGYAWVLGRHWNLEGELGLGYAYCRYDKFNCMDCGRKVEKDKSYNYFGLTKIALSLVYVF